MNYALVANPPISYAYLWNPTGNAFIEPTLSSTALAVTSLQSLPAGNGDWQSVSLLNSTSPRSYPIVSFSYIVAYKELNVYGSAMTQDRALALVEFLSYVVHGGQGLAAALNYVPLPPNVVAIDDATISSITYNGLPPSPSAPPPPTPKSFEADLTGLVGWNVEGLSTTLANLLVSHQVSVSVPIGPVSLTPVSESGSFQQSINLSTRIESPGTVTAILQMFETSLLPSFHATPRSSTATGPLMTSINQVLLAKSNDPFYTEWWVNGPLSNGSPVQILNGWTSVTGSENLNLPGIGTRPAWIATSQPNQTLSIMLPSMMGVTAPATSTNIAMNLNLLWSYDKSSDLLLRTVKTATLTIHSVALQNLPNTCYPSCSGSPYTTVTVTNDMSANLNVALLLSSTDISLAKPHPASSTSSLMDLLAGLPWMSAGFAGLAAGAIIGVTVWLTRKYRRTVMPKPTPSSGAAPTF
jgi:hypothetical protein